MQRRSFVVRAIASFAVVAGAQRPVLARAFAGTRPRVTIRRHGIWGAVPGGCGDHRRRGRMHAGYSRYDALVRFAR
jgi:hypothetical protein